MNHRVEGQIRPADADWHRRQRLHVLARDVAREAVGLVDGHAGASPFLGIVGAAADPADRHVWGLRQPQALPLYLVLSMLAFVGGLTGAWGELTGTFSEGDPWRVGVGLLGVVGALVGFHGLRTLAKWPLIVGAVANLATWSWIVLHAVAAGGVHPGLVGMALVLLLTSSRVAVDVVNRAGC